jgi:hypothetical protein
MSTKVVARLPFIQFVSQCKSEIERLCYFMNLNPKDFVLMSEGVEKMGKVDWLELTKFLSTHYLPGFC